MRYRELFETPVNVIEVAEKIAELVPDAIEIWFHGSRARGDNKRNSDWDFVVVISDDANYPQYAYANHPIHHLGQKIDVTPAQDSDRNRDGSVLFWAIEEGRCVWKKSGI